MLADTARTVEKFKENKNVNVIILQSTVAILKSAVYDYKSMDSIRGEPD